MSKRAPAALLLALAASSLVLSRAAAVVPTAQVKWVKAEAVALSSSRTPQPRDCLTTCANVGMSPVTGASPTLNAAQLCGVKATNTLCAVVVTAANDEPHYPHNLHLLPGTRVGDGSTPCWGKPCMAAVSATGAVKPVYDDYSYRYRYFCGCLPNPVEFHGAWTSGPQAACPQGTATLASYPGGLVLTDGDVLAAPNTGVHLAAICRISKSSTYPAAIGLMGYVVDGKACVVSLLNGNEMKDTAFDRLCVREEMSGLPQLVI